MQDTLYELCERVNHMRAKWNVSSQLELTLDSDPVVFSIFSSEAAGQTSVKTCVLHLQTALLIKLCGLLYISN